LRAVELRRDPKVPPAGLTPHAQRTIAKSTASQCGLRNNKKGGRMSAGSSHIYEVVDKPIKPLAILIGCFGEHEISEYDAQFELAAATHEQRYTRKE
jgi:hypothetical protein